MIWGGWILDGVDYEIVGMVRGAIIFEKKYGMKHRRIDDMGNDDGV